MVEFQKCLALSLTVLLLVVCSCSGQDENSKTDVGRTKTSNKNGKYKVDSGLVENKIPDIESDDYDWNNHDDYMHPEYSVDDPDTYNIPPSPIPITNETKLDLPNNTISSNPNTLETSPSTNETSLPVSSSLQTSNSSVNTSDSNAQNEESQSQPNKNETAVPSETSDEGKDREKVEEGNDQTNDSNSLLSTESRESINETTTILSTTGKEENESAKTDDGNPDVTYTTSSKLPPTNTTTTIEPAPTTIEPTPVVTEDVGDSFTNYTGPTPGVILGELESTGLRAWAVVVVSVLVSFTIIFSILYLIRGTLIRRRRADQRRLLRGSISSEGYFYGDGEGNTTGKFEL